MKSRLQPRKLIGTLLVLFLAASCGEPRQLAERIFTNARVVTMNDRSPAAEAFAVAGGKIIAVGTNEDLRARFSGTPESDLEGKTVMPGIIESHGHLLNLGQSAMELNLVGVATPEGAAEKVAERVAQKPPGEWIIGWGWDEGAWASNYPTNYVLNQVAPKHPVWLKGLHGFAGWANAKALEVAGVGRKTPDPENGRILKDGVKGVPTGILLNQAQSLVSTHIPPLAPQKIEEALMLAQQRCLEHGLTSVHDANVTSPVLDALHALSAAGRLQIRVYAMLDGTDQELIESYLSRGPEIGDWLTVRSIKVFADGALGSRGAALIEPYADKPETSGVARISTEDLTSLTSRALGAGFQVATHAIGDLANRNALDAYEAALNARTDSRDARLRVEHAQVVRLEDIGRFAQLGIICSMQPPHCTSDMPWAEARVGPERIKGAYAWRRFLDAGVRLVLNSDFPGENLNPFSGMYAAETRQTAEGKPADGWYADQRLTRQEVLRAYTVESARAAFEESVKGQIASGMVADFVVLSGDVTAIPARSLLALRVEQTYVAGKRVF